MPACRREKPKDSNGPRPGIKESLRWIEGYKRVAERSQALPELRQLYVADREADIPALRVKARELACAADDLIGCRHNRALPEGDKLWARLAQAPMRGSARFELPAGRGRKARRTAEHHVHAGQEANPSVGTQPVVWRRLSNRPVNKLEQALELIG